MLLNEFGNGSRRPASEISDGVGDRYCFSARTLIGTDSENAFDDGGRNAFTNAARPRFLWRLIDKPQFLADYGADDLRSMPMDAEIATLRAELAAIRSVLATIAADRPTQTAVVAP